MLVVAFFFFFFLKIDMILKKNYVQRSRAGLHEGTGGRKASTRLCREPWAEQSIPTKPCPPSTTCCVIFGSSFPLYIPPPALGCTGCSPSPCQAFWQQVPVLPAEGELCCSGAGGEVTDGEAGAHEAAAPCAISSHLARPPLLQIHALPQNPAGMGKRGPSHRRRGM